MKIVIIGLGSMGKRRIRLLSYMYPDNDIVGIDSDAGRIQEVKDQYGIKCYSNMCEVKKHERNIDCAFVCTSPLSHGSIIRECLLSDWNVFTEINLVSDLYDENIQLAAKRNLLLFLSSTPIYRDEMKIIDEIVRTNNKPVNYIYHIGQYLPDWHPWESFHDFFATDKRSNGCREIMAIELPWMTRTFGNVVDIRVIMTSLTNLDLQYRDNFVIQMVHENGTTGVFCVDVVCRQAVRKLEIYNEDIYIEWNGKPETLKRKNLSTGNMDSICVNHYHNQAGYSDFVNEYAYMNEIEAFIQALYGQKVIYGFKEDKNILSLIDQIEQY